jgi:hypothetical protein
MPAWATTLARIANSVDAASQDESPWGLSARGHQRFRPRCRGICIHTNAFKTPKLYWSDTGLALFLAGEERPRGAHLENLVLCDLLACLARANAASNPVPAVATSVCYR